jgi:hypothetical protein
VKAEVSNAVTVTALWLGPICWLQWGHRIQIRWRRPKPVISSSRNRNRAGVRSHAQTASTPARPPIPGLRPVSARPMEQSPTQPT